MPAQSIVQTKLISNGTYYNVRLIENPTIDDVLQAEAKIYAFEMATKSVNEDRRVGRDIRGFLIRTGVER